MKGFRQAWQATDEFIFEPREEDKTKKIRKDLCEKWRRKSRKNTAFSNRRFHPIFRPARTTDGSPTNLTRIVRYNCSQEQANTNWTGNSPALQLGSYSGATSADLRFTEWVIPGTTNFIQISGDCAGSSSLALSDCQLHGGKFEFPCTVVSATNCLLDRSCVIIDENFYLSSLDPQVRNCTFNGGYLYLFNFWGGSWGFTNNLFSGTTISTNGPNNVPASYNGYVTNAICKPLLATDTNRMTSTLTFQYGPLGRFYLPADCIFTNAGNTTADVLGLYHWTTTTNQWKETNSVVDIGFHFVALNGTNATSLPMDTDNDGIPDYVEDSNASGTLDHRETKPNDAADLGLRVFITRPRSGSTIP